MTLSQSQSFKNVYYVLAVKSFLIWAFALTVCLLIIGFPLIILMVTIGSLLAVILQSVLPVSAVLVVASTILGFNLLGIMLGAAILTLKGVHPQDVSWLRWLHGEADPHHTSIYAACPLTCDVKG
ncbi:hypothetical protein [Stenomitos frigidus]|uniref:Uncharacterized protein n=1 Tax=Stenomitos frigidus ULC18 TaxID=2107698 RepID=A0A2T1E4T4_9CYAN|nr:hypothetical protein [Stenomitos frigidus]PSB27736.1 hypothetical protein C7B82_15200 [Stenomitos frigidus ULC18]